MAGTGLWWKARCASCMATRGTGSTTRKRPEREATAIIDGWRGTILEAIGWSEEKIDREFNRDGPTFTREQIAFVAEKILAAAFDRIESCIPDTIPLAEYQQRRESIDHAISMAMDTAGMALAILFAQTTGEGMGVWDWAGSEEFRDTSCTVCPRTHRPGLAGLESRGKVLPRNETLCGVVCHGMGGNHTVDNWPV